jgi:D-alanyl-D-alanine dipeptidase
MKTVICSKVISIADPRVLSIPVIENNDPMVDLKEQHLIAFGPSPEVQNNIDYTKIRNTVYQKLLEAQKKLSKNLRFCIYEGYRSLKLQAKLFDDRYNILKHDYPNWDHTKLFIETTKLVSPIMNFDGSQNIPPHSTGAAIDIYLTDNIGNEVDMGILVKDWMKDIDGSLSEINSERISDEAKKNRSIMSCALQSVGFVNYLGEYWHWSYGDRYWAYCSGEKFALYGSV